jgi:putative ABC transport system permease protein
MKNLPLVIAALRRKPTRTALTMLGVVIAFLLFGLLQGVDSAFSVTLQRMQLDRIFVDSRFSQPLPLSYRERLSRVAGIARMTEIAFLDGYYQDQKNDVLVIATNPATWLGIRPEYSIANEQINALGHTRNGAIITDWLAKHNGWKIGDQFTLRTHTPLVSGGSDWTFVIMGIMKYPDPTEELSLLLANFAYYDEGRTTDRGTADRYLLRIDDPRHSARICRQIDALFATSGVQTRTQTEHEMGQSQMASIGDISFFTRSIIGAVFFTLLILTGNTMMESVRERTPELAVLKALGYTDRAVLGLVIAESTLLCVTASVVGLALAAAMFPLASSYVETTIFPPIVIVAGVGIAICVGLISGIMPAWRAQRLKVVDALAAR